MKMDDGDVEGCIWRGEKREMKWEKDMGRIWYEE